MAPGDLTYEIVDDGIVLNWTAPVADAGSVTGYQVLRRKPDSQPRLTVWEEDTGSTETTVQGRGRQVPRRGLPVPGDRPAREPAPPACFGGRRAAGRVR